MEVHIDETLRCVKPLGRLDANSSLELDRALSTLPDNGQDMIIDLSECPYLSSAGIRILLKAKKRQQSFGNELFLTSVIPEIFQVLEIAGLHRIFRFEASTEAALSIIGKNRGKGSGVTEFVVAGYPWIWQSSDIEPITGQFYHEPDVLSYHELGFAIGLGTLSDPTAIDDLSDLFTAMDTCCGFLPIDIMTDPDARIASDPVKTGIPVREALSFGHQPSGILKMAASGKIKLGQVGGAIDILTAKYPGTTILAVIASSDKYEPSLSIGLVNGGSMEMAGKSGLQHLSRYISGHSPEKNFTGITFKLASLDLSGMEDALSGLISQNLNFENILSVDPVNQEADITDPVAWLFIAGNFVDGKSRRLIIETKAGSVFEPYKAFLARLLYTDSSKLLIDQLHGGFSAQTFQVQSFDHEGRKMRPTVLKIGSRNLVNRESERCKLYALPYIFNNSAVVLGAEFYGDFGALRYNFVGIGGESTQLKWLTHYYLTSDMEILDPLFDKIFMHILKPWYGQPVSKTIFPFRDHDPTFTFFSGIYKTVEELLSISPEEKSISIPEISRPILNPYWYLKHEYARRRDWSIEYFTGICHGDLNMQNILLDESMNVYLIDFSETKPRAIISDFARLEAIFLIDNAPLGDERDMADYLDFIIRFYKTDRLDEVPDITYTGKHREKVLKNAALTLKMRKYAFAGAKENPDAIPYWIALLEWVLPIVCFYSLPLPPRKLSMIVSSILCEKLMAAEEES